MALIFKDEKILIQEINKGNKKAFTFIYHKYYGDLCKYIYGYTKNRHKAEDVVQSTMLYIWDKKEHLNAEKSFKSYIYQIAYHQFINSYRQEKDKDNFIIEYKHTALSYFIEEKEELISEKSILVKKAIEDLPPKCKEAFLLNKKHGLKYKEVAKELNISVKTVEIHISKAIKRLKEKISKEKFKKIYY
jgi:RNA polymerase sigma-70 factor (ECF subfamily)